MASSKPSASFSAMTSSASEESSVVTVLDSNEPLVASSSSGPLRVQVLNSEEPLVPVSPCVQVLDSGEPLVQVMPAVPFRTEPEADCSSPAFATSELVMPVVSSTLSEDGVEGEPHASGSSGRRTTYNVEEIKSQWNMRKLLTVLGTDAQCIRFAEDEGLLPTEKLCNYHKRPMSLRTAGNAGQLGIFRCTKSMCRNKTQSRAIGTWFENARLTISLVFHIMYMFSQNYTYLQVQRETAREGEPVISTGTIADWFSYCRETLVVYELEHSKAQGKIGGPGKIVQIDESKFGKRKYNRGRHIEGHWVLSMIENGSDDLRLEVCPENVRSAEILVPLIQKHVVEGSQIHTDFWRAYDCLPQHGYIHKKVNHSDPVNRFVAPDGGHTQRIESHWRNFKVKFNKDQYKGNFTDWLVEYTWRRKIRVQLKDPFLELVKAIKYFYKID